MSVRLSRLLLSVAALIALASTGPVACAADVPALEQVESTHFLPKLTKPLGTRDPSKPVPYGYFKQEAIWVDHTINVCWHMDSARYEATRSDRHLVTAAIANTWEKVAAVKFVGWRRCGSSITNGFGIDEADVNPASAALGSELNGNLDGVTFDFEYAKWSSNFCLSQKAYCNRLIAVHEFGHTLGLAHEQNRSDTPKGPECTADPQGENGDVTVGKWDLASVMNYCNPEWNGDGNLSAVDVQTIQEMYGASGAPTKSALELHFKPQLLHGSCEIDNASLSLFPDGHGEFDAGVFSHTNKPVSDVMHLVLKDKSNAVLSTTPDYSSPRLTNAQQLWHATFDFTGHDYTSIYRATMYSNIGHIC